MSKSTGNKTTSNGSTSSYAPLSSPSFTGSVNTDTNYQINNTTVLNASTLGSTITNSSLTSVGTLSNLTVSGNITAGNVSTTNLTGTLKTASQPNITSVGTLTSLNLANGSNLSINNTEVINQNGLGTGILTSYLNSIGNMTTSTIYYIKTTTLIQTTNTATANNLSLQLSNNSSPPTIQYQKYTFSLPASSTSLTLPLLSNYGFIMFSLRSSTNSYYLSAEIYCYTNGVSPSALVSSRVGFNNAPTLQISTINSSSVPSLSLIFSATSIALSFTVCCYYFNE